MNVEFWEDFIQIYKENPCLWNTKCVDYNNKFKRNIAYGLLVEKLWELDENADMDMVRLKIESFRALFKKEKMRMESTKITGGNCEPVWPYYKSFLFLDPYMDEIITPESTIDDVNVDSISSNMLSNPPDSSSGTETSQSQDLEESIQSSYLPRVNHNTETAVNTQTGNTNSPPPKRRKTNDETVEDEEDDSATFTAHLKARMRNFDPHQKCIAQKLISDVMFLAETKQLQLTTSIVNLERS